MPKRCDLKTILVIGSGPIIIGQGCEFDYSGTQACLALKEEGYRVVLINSNPATIMTDPGIAHQIYIEPITSTEVEKIIQKEKPDALLPTMGGQIAINVTMELIQRNVLSQNNVELIGANGHSLEKAEDRDLFRQAMNKIGLETSESRIANNLNEAIYAQKSLSFPVMIRPSFTLGGSGSGIAYNEQEFNEFCERAFNLSPTNRVLIESSLLGWKEFELEVVRDRNDNCIIICAIENIDPMGVHTGDSITVAPAQTLTDKEYQLLRRASIEILREIGVETGGANVQFAVDPKSGKFKVIEMNPRVSRSSALASKATGFPIARVAAKLAVGYTLDELKNEITGNYMPASFEPTIDYVAVKIPRFHFEKFKGASNKLGTQMHSVGEVLALGSTFQAAIQKALSGLEITVSGFKQFRQEPSNKKELEYCLKTPTPERIFHVAHALRVGFSVEKINKLTSIDPWFLFQIQELIQIEKLLQENFGEVEKFSDEQWRFVKQRGFTDKYIAELVGADELKVRYERERKGVIPNYKQVDTCSGEFPSKTAYLYSTYSGHCEAKPSHRQKVMILGSGPNRIGQGIEFDYCCVHAALAAKEAGFETIMVNCNPETVSTDFSVSDKLYLEPITLEQVLSIYHLEKPIGIMIQFGGQTPLKLANSLKAAGVSILGTTVENINRSEEREQFRQLIQKLNLMQPEGEDVLTLDAGMKAAKRLSYPIIARPSYVLGGQGMEIIHSEIRLREYFKNNLNLNGPHSVLIEKFLENAIELDVDLIRDGNKTWIAGILEHKEKAGIHSGDSTCVIPPFSLSQELMSEVGRQACQLADALEVVGLMNVQFAIQNNQIYILESNLRASRTVPFISKALGLPIAKIATRCVLGESLEKQGITRYIIPKEICIKFPIFVFDKFKGTDKTLGPEMRSIGEVMGTGVDLQTAYSKFSCEAW